MSDSAASYEQEETSDQDDEEKLLIEINVLKLELAEQRQRHAMYQQALEWWQTMKTQQDKEMDSFVL
jgi:hypothetical protein